MCLWPSCLLWKSIFSAFCSFLIVFFFFLVCLFVFILSCISCLYILVINPLSVISFANIFSHSVGCLFILLTVYFSVQNLLNLFRPLLFIFAFVSFASGERSKKILLRFMLKSILPVFSSRSFMYLDLIFRLLIHF